MKKVLFPILALVLALGLALPMATPVMAAETTNSPTVHSGAWTNGGNAFSSNDQYATTSTHNAQHTFWDYGFSLGTDVIGKVEVGVEAYVGQTSPDEKLRVQVSFDAGSTWVAWSSWYTPPNSDPGTVYWWDFTGVTTWTATKLSDANFRVRIDYSKDGTPLPAYLDWIPVRVTHSPVAEPETADVIFDQTGVGTDFTGTVLTIDGTELYDVGDFTVTKTWEVGTDHTFAYGSPLVVDGKRYVWTSTSGGLTTDQSGTITVASDGGEVTGNYGTQYYLTLASDPSGVGTQTGEGWYNDGDPANISTDEDVDIVSGESRYYFDGWTTGDMGEIDDPSATSTQVTMDKDKTVTANYKTQYYLTVTSAHGTPGGDGWYDAGTNAQATVTPLTVAGPAGTQYVFTNWNDDATGTTSPSDNILMDGPKTATANWKTQYYLTLESDPSGVGTQTGAGWYDAGDPANISTDEDVDIVSGESRYHFDGWTTDDMDEIDEPSATSTTVTMDKAKTVTANYETQYYLTLESDPSGTGTQTGAGWYDEDTDAEIGTDEYVDIDPGASRYRFDGWTTTDMSEIDDPSATSTTVLMDKAKMVTANYDTQYYLTVTSAHGTPGGDGWYDSGTNAQATVTPLTVAGPAGTQYVFTNWSGDATGTTSPSNDILMNAPKTATANWKTQYLVSFTQTGSAVAPTVDYTANTDPTDTVPFDVWVKAGTDITYTYQDIVDGGPGVQYVLTSVSPESPQTVNGALTIEGAYHTEYYLTLVTSPADLTTPTGAGWYDADTDADISTSNPVGNYYFAGWTTGDLSEIDEQYALATTVFMDKAKTVTANYRLRIAATGGKTLGFWSNKNGQSYINGTDLPFLRDILNLVNKNGSAFDPTTYTQLKNWLLKADATNMAYMLSAQLAATELSVFNGLLIGSQQVWVDDGDLIVEPGEVMTINDIMTAANNELGTPTTRANQEYLKNLLDKINNNLLWFIV